MGRKVLAMLGDDLRGKSVAILGLTFKPNTDDMRDAPSIAIVPSLTDAGVNVRAFDPEGMEAARSVMPAALSYCSDPYECASGADAVVIATEWDAFRALDLARLKSIVNAAVLVDLRNIYDCQDAERSGFAYTVAGR